MKLLQQSALADVILVLKFTVPVMRSLVDDEVRRKCAQPLRPMLIELSKITSDILDSVDLSPPQDYFEVDSDSSLHI
jgi:hypothetical protein